MKNTLQMRRRILYELRNNIISIHIGILNTKYSQQVSKNSCSCKFARVAASSMSFSCGSFSTICQCRC